MLYLHDVSTSLFGDIDIEEEAEAGNATMNITNQTEVTAVVVEEEAGNATMTA